MLYKNKIKRKQSIKDYVFYIKNNIYIYLLFFMKSIGLNKTFDKVILKQIESIFLKDYKEIRYYLYGAPFRNNTDKILHLSLEEEYAYFCNSNGMSSFYSKYLFLKFYTIIELHLSKYRKLHEKDVANDLEIRYHKGKNDSETYFYIKMSE